MGNTLIIVMVTLGVTLMVGKLNSIQERLAALQKIVNFPYQKTNVIDFSVAKEKIMQKRKDDLEISS
jgi:hypothetical protein